MHTRLCTAICLVLAAMRIGLISDTHSWLDERVFHHFSECDEIWHAGDIGNLQVTDDLAAFKPLRAVYGNIDGAEIRRVHPLHQRFSIEGKNIWMTHIGGRPGYYNRFIRERLIAHPPDLFICGHSHILRVEMDKKNKFLYMNPGAAGRHGFHKIRTLIRFSITQNGFENLEVIELGSRT
jgi:putative phosphoesterase